LNIDPIPRHSISLLLYPKCRSLAGINLDGDIYRLTTSVLKLVCMGADIELQRNPALTGETETESGIVDKKLSNLDPNLNQRCFPLEWVSRAAALSTILD
jgi:hypothetical protein